MGLLRPVRPRVSAGSKVPLAHSGSNECGGRNRYLCGVRLGRLSGLGDSNARRGTAAQRRNAEGIAQNEETLAALRGTGSKLPLPHLLSWLAQECKDNGQFEDGLSALTKALVAINEHDIRHYEAEAYRLEGESLLRQNDLAAAKARECSDRAIEIARGQRARSLELRATTSLARLLAQQGRREEGRARSCRNLRLVHGGLRHRRPQGRQGVARRAEQFTMIHDGAIAIVRGTFVRRTGRQ
jgi:tetratricopeptide (TPR) repeat protein